MSHATRSFFVVMLILFLLVGTVGCIAGTERYEESKATFWSGLFHGFISPVTLFITLFTGAIDMYEPNNVGWGYDAGFFLGVLLVLGGGRGSQKTVCRLGKSKKTKSGWDALGDEIGREILEAVRSAKDSEGTEDESWQELGRKIEAKIKRKLKEWADKE